MARFVLARLLGLPLVLLGMSLLVFVLMTYVPGNSASALLGPYATPERVAEVERSLGLDASLPEQYVSWLGRVLNFDFGYAYSLGRPATEVIKARIFPTLTLAGVALALGSLAGLLLGVGAARFHGRAADRVLSLVTLVGLSVPAFWLAMLLILVLAVETRWFPVSGIASVFGPERDGLLDRLHHLVLPSLALSVVPAGVLGRMVRGEMLEALQSSAIGMARAKGLDESEVVGVHAFRLALSRAVPVIGLQAGFVIGGAIYVETVFQWPGLGRMLVDAVLSRDLMLVQGGVLVLATAYSLIMLGSDVAQRALDPRIGAR